MHGYCVKVVHLLLLKSSLFNPRYTNWLNRKFSLNFMELSPSKKSKSFHNINS